jgi:hypothetical protein
MDLSNDNIAKPVTAPKLTTALLCAAGGNKDGNPDAAALLDVGGEPLIAFQIAQLRSCGIHSFLIEIEELPGALAAMTERLRAQGAVVSYVRSPKELAAILSDDELLFVLCDGIIADDMLLKEIIANPSRYIVTLDGRDENSQYERIDLNSFWAGIALLDIASIRAISSLPEGWSIRSSLLRQALQDAVPHRPLNQELVLANQLRRIKTPEQAADFGKHMLARNSRNVTGVIESKLFAPVIAAIAPKMWKSPIAVRILQFALPLLAVGVLATVLAGASPVAAAFATICIFGLQLKQLLQNNDNTQFFAKLITTGIWTSLGAGFIFVDWKDAPQPFMAIFPPAIVLGILLIARKLPITGWQHAALSSPALLAAATLLFSVIGHLPLGIALLAMTQIGLLLFPLYFRDKTG